MDRNDTSEGSAVFPSSDTAVNYAERLLSCFKSGDYFSTDAFATVLSDIFSRTPEIVVMAICDPMTGLPSTLKFAPSLMEIHEAISAETRKREQIVSAMQWQLAERARRDEEYHRRGGKPLPTPQQAPSRSNSNRNRGKVYRPGETEEERKVRIRDELDQIAAASRARREAGEPGPYDLRRE